MEKKYKEKVVDFFEQILKIYDFKLVVNVDKNIFKLQDIQNGNLGGIEQEEFETLEDIMERLDIYHEDYIYRSLNERNLANEIIPKDDWDLTAKRYIESNFIAEILNDISVNKYDKMKSYLSNFDIKEIINILDEEEQFYKIICQKYIKTMEKEMLLKKDDQILHIFIKDEYIDLKHDGKINNENYQNYLDDNFEIYKYNSYQELYNFVIEDEIEHDIEDLGLFDENSKWNFYINFEELKKMGYGFMVKDYYPLIEKYAVSDEKIIDFFNHFSLEQLDNFEETLKYYFIEHSIVYNEYEGLTINPISHFKDKESYTFNSDIIRLACGLMSYEDFIEDYKEHTSAFYDIEKVTENATTIYETCVNLKDKNNYKENELEY